MKARTVVFSVLISALFLGASAWASPPGPGVPAAGVASGGRYVLTNEAPFGSGVAAAEYSVKAGASAGGVYRLTSLAWRAGAASSGGVYRLLGPASPSGGNPCCCSYLPCVVRTY